MPDPTPAADEPVSELQAEYVRFERDGAETDNGADGGDEAGAGTEPSTRADVGFQEVTGAVAMGTNAKAFSFTIQGNRQVTVLRSVRTAKLIAQAQEVHVRGSGFDQELAALRQNHLLYRRGRAGSGRRTEAEMLLAAEVGPDKVAGVEVAQGDVSLAELAGERELLQKGHGIVLELPSPGLVTANTLSTFATLARESSAYLVILDDRTGASDAALRPYEVLHTPPPAAAVLRRHLFWHLRQLSRCFADCEVCTGACHSAFVDKCLAHEEVVAQLAANPLPGQMAELATALAGVTGPEAELVHRALQGLRVRAREMAARLLAGTDGAGQAQEPDQTPRRQAFQIAYAVFHEYRLADAFDAGQLLLQVLWIAQRREGHPSLALFDGGVDEMLRGKDQDKDQDLAAHLRESNSVEEHPRRARLADPRLLLDILDVAWNDFDTVRGPLLFWLHQLVLNGRDGVRLRAAGVAGWLATYDFDEVYRLLIGPWARAKRGATRQAAAWALEISAGDSRLLGRVRHRVRDWVKAASTELHDCAARAYGTRIGALFPEDALQDLRVLAERSDLYLYSSVAYALQSLYDTAPEQVHQTITEWNRADLHRLRVHAARAFILLSDRRAASPDDLWPALLTRAPAAGLDQLVGLWRAALTEARTAFRAWKALRSWLDRAERDPELAEVVLDLCRQVLGGRLADRGRFHLRAWQQDVPPSDLARQLLENWTD